MAKVVVPKLKIMVASTIYGFEDQLTQICSTLQGYGYEVWNSYLKTVPVHPGLSNQENCLRAVETCDLFYGIIRPRYGANIDGISITHHEVQKAIELKKPRWFIAHRDISVARQLFKQFMYNADKSRNTSFSYIPTNIMDDLRVIDMYNEVIQNDIPAAERAGHWIEEFHVVGDILRSVETQFQDTERIRKIVTDMNQPTI